METISYPILDINEMQTIFSVNDIQVIFNTDIKTGQKLENGTCVFILNVE